MCSPGVMKHVHQALSRRDLFKLGAGAALAAALPGGLVRAQESRTLRFANVQDLTHTLSPGFPVFPAYEPMRVTKLFDVAADGFFANRWDVGEHSGTHLDAPAHFIAGGVTVEGLEPADLLAPIAVIDLRERAAEDPDTALTVGDLTAWEAEHGPLPDGAAVFLSSGWDARAGDGDAFLNADAEGVLHFPGFSPEAATFLVNERRIVGIGVDTPSLDVTGALAPP